LRVHRTSFLFFLLTALPFAVPALEFDANFTPHIFVRTSVSYGFEGLVFSTLVFSRVSLLLVSPRCPRAGFLWKRCFATLGLTPFLLSWIFFDGPPQRGKWDQTFPFGLVSPSLGHSLRSPISCRDCVFPIPDGPLPPPFPFLEPRVI